MAEVKKYLGVDSGIEVTAMLIETEDDIRDLRAARDWHEGDVACLSYPTQGLVAFVSLDNPKYLHGRAVALRQAVVKGPAGDWGVVPIPGFLEKYEEVEAA